MIASVTGEVLVRRPDHVVVEAGGVGYRLAVSAETLKAVPARGKKATLHSHLVARDDGLNLYGFGSEEERDLFLQLISIGGVGPKVALAALSGGPVRELLRAIAAGDAKRFQAVPGIGKRTAERIIVELREKVAGEIAADAEVGSDGDADPRSLAREGLLNLGYTPVEAERLLDGAEGTSPEEIVQSALRRAAGGTKTTDAKAKAK
jgi:Holliday junction DNA helicase RuvA